MRVIQRLRKRLHADDGFTVVEIMVASALASIGLTMIGGFLVSAFNTTAFSQGQAQTINDVRTAMYMLEKEVRGSDSIEWCSPPGTCLKVSAQKVDGTGFRTLRYTHVDTELRREEFNPGTSTWSSPQTIIERVANSPSQPVFACDTQASLLKVTIDLRIEPTPQSDPVLNAKTSVRPRNYPSAAVCP